MSGDRQTNNMTEIGRSNIHGLHHITAIARDPQKNVDFYAAVLGLRLVKKTVNFDDPYTYHFYFGDDEGRPGSLITFFPWPADTRGGRKGAGQLTGFSFSIPRESIGFWKERLSAFNVACSISENRWGEEVLSATDHDGFQFELAASSGEGRAGSDGPISSREAIRALHGVSMSVADVEPTVDFLTRTLGFRRNGESENRFRFEGNRTFIEVLHEPHAQRGAMGAGSIHHVAWRTPDDATQLEVRNMLIDHGYRVTPVIDRNYFHSIYFNDPEGAIFEVATDLPGFLIDETKAMLGMSLRLPPQYEPYRAELERALPPITVPITEESMRERFTAVKNQKSVQTRNGEIVPNNRGIQ